MMSIIVILIGFMSKFEFFFMWIVFKLKLDVLVIFFMSSREITIQLVRETETVEDSGWSFGESELGSRGEGWRNC
jgi:hypothetical protein